MKIKTEIELCQKFIEAHPRNEHLYYEVYLPGGRCDIIHKEHNIISIYEAKLILNIKLLEQCVNRKLYANFVYAVVPDSRRRRGDSFLESLFSDYGIGIINFRAESSSYNDWRHFRDIPVLWQRVEPAFNRCPKSITLYEENKVQLPGSQNSGITPFAIMVKNMKLYLEKKKQATINEMFERQSYYGTLKQFKTNIYQWIRVGVIDGIYIENGIIYLSELTSKE